MKGARPVWPVEATGNPPQPTGTAALVYWAGALELRGHHTWRHQVAAAKWHPRQPPSQSPIWTFAVPRSSFILHFRAARRREGWALRETVQNQALQ